MKVVNKGYCMRFDEVPVGGVFKYKDRIFIKMESIPACAYGKVAFLMAGNSLELTTGKREDIEFCFTVCYYPNATIAI